MPYNERRRYHGPCHRRRDKAEIVDGGGVATNLRQQFRVSPYCASSDTFIFEAFFEGYGRSAVAKNSYCLFLEEARKTTCARTTAAVPKRALTRFPVGAYA